MNNHEPTETELDSALSGASDNEYKIAFKKEDKKSAIYKTAKYLIEKYHVKTIKGFKREIMIYENGVYISGEEIVKKEIRSLLEELTSTHHLKEIIETVKDLTPIDRDDFFTDKNLLNLNNGILNMRTGEFLKHDPKYLFLTKIPVNFNSKADCPMIKKFLSDILDDEQILIIQEWIGYGLYTEYFIKKAIIFVGEGDTGKTTLISLLIAFYGAKNVSGVSLQKISVDKFSSAHLFAKYINLYDDLSFKDIKDNGMFKIATGGGTITGEKKFGDQFQFENYSKLTFACNKIPDVADSDDKAYFNRWIVIFFDCPVEEKNKDKHLIHKLTTPEELSGLLNFSLEGLQRLLKNGNFSYNKTAEEIKIEMTCSSSSIADFSFECLEQDDVGWISKEDMFCAYTQFTNSKKISRKSKTKLGKDLYKHATYINPDGKPKDPKTGKQVTAWMNVKFKDSFKPSLPEKNEEPEQQKLINNIS